MHHFRLIHFSGEKNFFFAFEIILNVDNSEHSVMIVKYHTCYLCQTLLKTSVEANE